MIKIDLNKKKNVQIIVAGAAVIFIFIGLFLYIPMIKKHQRLSHELKSVNQEIDLVNQVLHEKNSSISPARLLSEDEVVLAIREITKAGSNFQIEFISISPGETQTLENEPYSRLPIEISVVADYKNLGLFLASLKDMDSGVITVRGFDIEKDERRFLLVKSLVIIEVYLKNG